MSYHHTVTVEVDTRDAADDLLARLGESEEFVAPHRPADTHVVAHAGPHRTVEELGTAMAPTGPARRGAGLCPGTALYLNPWLYL